MDAAMNDLIRPSLYNAHHEIIHVNKDAKNDVQNDGECWDIVGPICETGDFLGKNRFLNLQEGSLLGMCFRLFAISFGSFKMLFLDVVKMRNHLPSKIKTLCRKTNNCRLSTD